MNMTTVDGDSLLRDEWKPLYLLNFYRLILGLIFVIASTTNLIPTYPFDFDTDFFNLISSVYCAFSIISLLMLFYRVMSYDWQVLGQSAIDILLIALLMHASGGVDSGVGILLVVAIAGGSLLSAGSTPFFLAATASLCVLMQVGVDNAYNYGYPKSSYTHASMLGITFFATAYLAYTLAQRARVSEALAAQRGVQMAYLARLNEQIVQQIQSGIIVIDIVGRIRLFNEAARRLLGLSQIPVGRALNVVSPELWQRLEQWRQQAQFTRNQIFHSPQGQVEVLATFTDLTWGSAENVLILLEDATLMHQRAQQLKLASLGRLAASIAHEVRNPLGAISHAGQLLAESPSLSAQDMRLTQIIAEQSHRVNVIVENVLQLSRRGQVQAQCFNLVMWLQNFIDEYNIQHGYAGEEVVLEVEESCLMVWFDTVQLYQVVGNLCENGLRYSRRLPLLRLTVGMSEEFDCPFLDVRDSGQGMTEEVAEHIFEPFFTTESTGSGLGLYVAKEICDANQSPLSMVENSSQGCCFRITFRLSHAEVEV